MESFVAVNMVGWIETKWDRTSLKFSRKKAIKLNSKFEVRWSKQMWNFIASDWLQSDWEEGSVYVLEIWWNRDFSIRSTWFVINEKIKIAQNIASNFTLNIINHEHNINGLQASRFCKASPPLFLSFRSIHTPIKQCNEIFYLRFFNLWAGHRSIIAFLA